MFNLGYSFESDNDDIDIDVRDSVTISDDTAVDDAFDDSETVDVHPDTKETAHNEAASAGGIATGSNQDQLEMDPVAATESFIRRWFGLSREDMDEAVDAAIVEAENAPNAEIEEDPELVETAAGGTSVSIISPVDTHIDVNAADDNVSVGSDTEVEAADPLPAEVAAIEGLRRLWSREDAMEGGDSDVELDVKTSDTDTNLQFEGKAITIQPNDDDGGSDDFGGGDDDGGSDDFGGGDDDSGDEGESDFGGGDDEGGDDEGGAPDPEEGTESFFYW